MASSELMAGMTKASGTMRGSADSTPSTSVQISITEASAPAPMMEAV